MISILYVIALNALLGILLLEFAWRESKPLRNISESRDSRLPGFRRLDVAGWKKWYFYPAAAIVLLPRLVSFVVFLVNHLIWLKLLLIGVKFEGDKPLTGVRMTLLK